MILNALLISCSKNEEFTLQKWQAYSPNERQFLVEDFLESYELMGMKKHDVIKLLGNETSEAPENEGYSIRYDTPENLTYDFGEKYLSPGTNLTLVIEFDENNTVTNFELLSYSQ